jgi:hypothetical protein
LFACEVFGFESLQRMQLVNAPDALRYALRDALVVR